MRLLPFLATLLLPPLLAAQEPVAKPPAPKQLTTAREVLQVEKSTLSELEWRATLRGVVTHVDRGLSWFFVQDDTGGMVVQQGVALLPSVGQQVEVEGVVVMNLNGILLEPRRVQVLGRSNLPASRLVKGEAVDTQAEYANLVTVEGRVTDACWRDGALNLVVRPLSNRVTVRVDGADPREPLETWINSRVRATGVNWFARGAKLHVSSPEDVILLSPGVTDESLPMVPLGRLPAQPGERIRTRAVVGWSFPDGAIMLQKDGAAAVFYMLNPVARLRTDDRFIMRPQTPLLTPGLSVEVAGSVSTYFAGSGGKALEDGALRSLGQGKPPQSVACKGRSLYDHANLYRLVTVEGRLISSEARSNNRVFREKLLLEADGTLFEAVYDSDDGRRISTLPRDYILEVTGFVTPPQPGLAAKPNQNLARVLLRTPADARTLRLSTGAIIRRVSWGLGGLALLAGAAGAWIWSLRRRVAESSAELRRALEAEREMNQLKSDFVSLVSHEFRTPLGVIMSSAEILENYFESLSPERRESQLARIVGASRRMAAMMEDVLILGRMEAGRMHFAPAPLDLPAFARKVTEDVLVATAHKNPVRLRLGTLPENAAGDAQLMQHIFTNLLMNAVKYSPEESIVNFEIQHKDGQALFTIEDQGIGIPTTDLPRLYDPFYRGRNVGNVPGTGLGMVIVRRCVDLHGGTIQARSRTGEGTSFVVTLPLFKDRPATPPAEPSIPPQAETP